MEGRQSGSGRADIWRIPLHPCRKVSWCKGPQGCNHDYPEKDRSSSFMSPSNSQLSVKCRSHARRSRVRQGQRQGKEGHPAPDPAQAKARRSQHAGTRRLRGSQRGSSRGRTQKAARGPSIVPKRTWWSKGRQLSSAKRCREEGASPLTPPSCRTPRSCLPVIRQGYRGNQRREDLGVDKRPGLCQLR